MAHILLIDDDTELTELLCELLKFENFTVSVAHDGEAGLNMMSPDVDMILLDVMMPKLNGIDFLKVLNPQPKVIFTTAYREYAIESYELDVVDYLLKPISFQRFLMAVSKAMNGQLAVAKEASQVVIPDELRSEQPYIFLKADRKMVKVYLKDILYIESLKDYVRIKMPQKDVVSLQKISFLEQKLPEDCFVRIHRSFIVPIRKIEAFSQNVIEINGAELPIGRNYKEKVLQILNNDTSILG